MTSIVGRKTIEGFCEVKITEQDVHRAYRIGNRRGRRPISVKLINFMEENGNSEKKVRRIW